MHTGILVTLLSLIYLSYANESVHAQPETSPQACRKLDDIIDDDNLSLFDELLSCELENANECNTTWESYECKQHLHELFFYGNFSAIDYGYSQDKFNLIRFIL